MANYVVSDTNLTAVANAIRTKGGTNDPISFPDGFVSEIGNIPSGGGGGPVTKKQVNFIDYDGTLLYSYTKTEANALTALPENPSHTGLTSQGWNWTLAQIKAQLTAIPDGDVWIGQMYVTDDDKTRLYCHFETGRLSPYLGICPNGTVTVDWGDGTATDTLTGTSLTTVQNVQHNYAAAGDYVITLTAAIGTTFAFSGSSTYYSYILRKDTDSTNSKYPSYVYRTSIEKIELGSSARISDYAFYYCYGLRSITMHSGITSVGSYAFYYCVGLMSVTIPSDVTSISSNAFYYCYNLTFIAIPQSVTLFHNNAFYYCHSLVSITIPSGITSTGNSCFRSCCGLTAIIMPSGITSISSSAFFDCYGLMSITMPSGITSIRSSAFSSCYSLASVTIPSDVASIDVNAFYSCYGIKEYHFLRTTPPSLSNSNVFSGIPSDCIIYVPRSENQAVLNAYKTANNWSNYASYMQEEPAA